MSQTLTSLFNYVIRSVFLVAHVDTVLHVFCACTQNVQQPAEMPWRSVGRCIDPFCTMQQPHLPPSLSERFPRSNKQLISQVASEDVFCFSSSLFFFLLLRLCYIFSLRSIIVMKDKLVVLSLFVSSLITFEPEDGFLRNLVSTTASRQRMFCIICY